MKQDRRRLQLDAQWLILLGAASLDEGEVDAAFGRRHADAQGRDGRILGRAWSWSWCSEAKIQFTVYL